MCAVYMPANMLGPPSPLMASGGTNWAEPVALDASDQPSASGGKIQPPDTPASNETLTFKDFLDIINPLQHIPVVGTIYRAITGDTMKDYTHILGDTLYSGPIGLLTSIGSVLYKEESGQSPEDTVLAAIGLGSEGAPDTTKPDATKGQTAVAGADSSGAATVNATGGNATSLAGTARVYGTRDYGSGVSAASLLAADATAPGATGGGGISIAKTDPSAPLVIRIPASAPAPAVKADASAGGGGAGSSVLQAFTPAAETSKPDAATISAAMDYGLKQYEAMNRITSGAPSSAPQP